MINHDTPSLDAISQLPDKQIQFYAIIGASVSLAAKLELLLFDVFVKATGINRDLAASVFFSIKNNSTVRDMATDAMAKAVENTPPLDGQWQALKGRITSATGQSGARNIISHMPVSRKDVVTGGPIMMAPIMAVPAGSIEGHSEYLVIQDKQKVLAGKQKARTEDFESLKSYCEELISLNNDISDFLSRV